MSRGLGLSTLVAGGLLLGGAGGCELVAGISERLYEPETEPPDTCLEGELRCTEALGVERCAGEAWVADRSHLGCEFSAVTLPMFRDAGEASSEFALLAANPGSEDAEVEVGGQRVTIPSGEARQIPVDFKTSVANPGARSAVFAAGAYRVTASRPVSLVQVNGANPEVHDVDASLLVPWHVAATTGAAAATPHVLSTIRDMSAHLAVVAKEPTSLTLTGVPTAHVFIDGLAVTANGSGSLQLGADDTLVLQTERTKGPSGSMCGWNQAAGYYGCGSEGVSVDFPRDCPDVMPGPEESCDPNAPSFGLVGCCANGGALAVWCQGSGPPCPDNPNGGMCHELCPFHEEDIAADVSGIQIVADKPVLAFAGHACALAPLKTKYCSHTEVPLLAPTAAAQVVVAPRPGIPWRVQIVATAPGTMVAAEPPLPPPITGEIAEAGQQIAFDATADGYVITANQPVAITATRLGSADTPPTATHALMVDRGSTDILFPVADRFDAVTVTVIGPSGTTVTVGSSTVPLTNPLGDSGLASSHIPLTTAGDVIAFHLTSPVPVLAQVYAEAKVDDFRRAAYWHPAALAFEAQP
ncbi:MAG: IgGFc-binding protein [Myxococcales bacterium]|nr:IgGFc-binding protein [Myxococcales bacterium]